MKWIKESNRMRHFWAGLVIGVFTTFVGSFIAGIYKEVKDRRNGGAFDWLDVLATVLGGLVGTVWAVISYFIYVKDGDLFTTLMFYFANPLFVCGWFIAFYGWGSFKKFFV